MWPAVNATLNATAAMLLVVGWRAIRAGQVTRHRRCMILAMAASTLFFVSYVLYHRSVGTVRFTGTGWIRSAYFAILISHTVLAVVIVPLVGRTAYLAWRQRFGSHRALARWTLPLWLYVSVTGVVIYWMLYQC